MAAVGVAVVARVVPQGHRGAGRDVRRREIRRPLGGPVRRALHAHADRHINVLEADTDVLSINGFEVNGIP